MEIRNRLTFRFSVIVAAIISICFIAIYFFSSFYRQSEFYGRLKNRGINTAKLLIDVNEVDSTLLRIIDQNTQNSLPEEAVIIYDFNNKIIYASDDNEPVKSYTDSLLNSIRIAKEIRFREGSKEAIGLVYNGNYDHFITIVSAYDKFGLSKLQNLKIILIISFLSSITITLIAGWFFASRALKPVALITAEASQISASNLKARINEGNRKDELAHLAITFNNMLNRIEKSFELQRSFVSNSSHELRTPLTAIRGQLEVTLLSDRTNNEYKEIIVSVLEDITKMISLTNNLLDIATANTDESVHRRIKIRVDEQLFAAREELLTRNPQYSAQVSIPALPSEENQLSILGSDQLLKCAFLNIMENGCKYSETNSVDVRFEVLNSEIQISFEDKGIGIPSEELSSITEPFYRASNAPPNMGYGLGLALTRGIIQLHKGQFNIKSELSVGTTIQVILNPIS